MKKSKVDISKFSSDVVISETQARFTAPSKGWCKTTSSIGKSQGIVVCGFCDNKQPMFIWSFVGGGKKCDNCGCIITHGRSFIDKVKLNEVDTEKIKLLIK